MLPFKAASAERARVGMLIELQPFTQSFLSAAGADLDSMAQSASSMNWIPTGYAGKVDDTHKRLVDMPGSKPDLPVVILNCIKFEQDLLGKEFKTALNDNGKAGLLKVFKNDAGEKSLLRIRIRIAFKEIKKDHGYNVCGKLPGKTGELILLGSHYDHLGLASSNAETEGQISYYPGADDNASGTAGVLELARLWLQRAQATRSVLFTSFTAEEDGLLGSQYMSTHLPIPKDSLIAMINLDMIGRDGFASMGEANKPGAKPTLDYAATFFSAPSPKLKDILRAASDSVPLKVDVRPVNSFQRFGDSGSFHKVGIPTIHIFSGFHSDYHEVTDTVDKLDWSKITRMTEMIDHIMLNLSETPGRIGFDPSIRVEGGGMPY
jgi:hypothetical protein